MADGVAKQMIMEQARRAEQSVLNSDYSKCPVPGERDVQIFLVQGMKYILSEVCNGKERDRTQMPQYKRMLLHPNAKIAYVVSAILAIKEMVMALWGAGGGAQ
jgi:hypothetical protein